MALKLMGMALCQARLRVGIAVIGTGFCAAAAGSEAINPPPYAPSPKQPITDQLWLKRVILREALK